MCQCKNVDLGSYENQIVLDRPPHMVGRTEGSSNQEKICIDSCIIEEIKHLWDCGIRTTGCCCGHNKINGFVGVVDADIELMISMGYEVQINPHRPQAKDTFNLKSQYCPICQRNIAPSNLYEVMTGEHDGIIFVHDEIPHDDDVIGMAKN